MKYLTKIVEHVTVFAFRKIFLIISEFGEEDRQPFAKSRIDDISAKHRLDFLT
ncbi:MAG: hypothetical protein LBF88_12815 [Planctomycetaceae bacterium]|nr:hypothetical protein [Planctomycetaceae bacterium]